MDVNLAALVVACHCFDRHQTVLDMEEWFHGLDSGR